MPDTLPCTDTPALLADIPFHAIVEQSVAGIYVLQDECFAYCNDTWAALVGYTREEVIGGHLSRFVPPYFLPKLLELSHKRLNAAPPSIRYITHAVHRLGHALRLDVQGSRIIYRGRPAVIGVGIDVTDRLRHEEEVQRSRQQLRELSAYTYRKLEEQRLSFARDVHDELGGMLTSIKMDATRVLRRVDTPELQVPTRGLIELTQKTIDTVRQISSAWRPSDLEHLDLSAKVAHDLDTFTERFGVRHELGAQATSLRLSPKRATAVYRIFHEALTNVARHAKATKVRVRMEIEG